MQKVFLCIGCLALLLAPETVDAANLRNRAMQRAQKRMAEKRPFPRRQERQRNRRQERRAKQQKIQKQQIAKRRAVLRLVNAERRHAGIRSLRYSRILERSAQLHAVDMDRYEYFSHTGRDESEPEDRIRDIGYLEITYETCNCTGYKATVGENIAKGQDTAQKVVDDWMNSPGHRKNILTNEFKEMGIGIVDDIWVQHFGGIELYLK